MNGVSSGMDVKNVTELSIDSKQEVVESSVAACAAIGMNSPSSPVM